jgi:hydroxymethylpyrimidine/phosphomethylpyrimidine kinase
VAALRCHAATVLTALTTQDSRNAYGVTPTPASAVAQQAEVLFDDLAIACVKIGFLGSAETAWAVERLLGLHPQVPVVLDPVIRAGGGAQLADAALVQALREALLPRAVVATPNAVEARQLCPGSADEAACARTLLDGGAAFVLITGVDESTDAVFNSLYADGRLLRRFQWPRLAHAYHGSGCTLSAAIAARLAHGDAPFQAIEAAQGYTWNCLKHARRPGRGQYFPERFYEDDA